MVDNKIRGIGRIKRQEGSVKLGVQKRVGEYKEKKVGRDEHNGK